MPNHEILAASALEQGRLIQSRAISAEELTRLYLARIAAHDPELSAFVQVLARSAIRHAKKKDREPFAGPFHGVPIGIKDLNFVRGAFTRFGSRAMQYLWSPVDDRGTAALRRGGFVILGKLSTSELGALPVTEPPIHPPTRNPWNLEVTPGGSSGGSAAAVAAGLLPIAQGSDGAGSIRIPAAFCHLFGFKASRGVVPDPYGRDDARNLTVSGPISRNVADAAAMLDVMADRSNHRERSPYSDLARQKPSRLRIRFLASSPLVEVHPEIVAGVRQTAGVLRDLGHSVEEGDSPVGTAEEFLPLWQRIIASVPILRPSHLGPVPGWLAREGKKLHAKDVDARHDDLAARIRGWFGDANLWLTPTVALPPPRIGALVRSEPRRTFEEAALLGAFTAIFNITGQPAASLPVGLMKNGLPIGVQLAGRVGSDGNLLALCREVEEAMPWRNRTAPFDGVRRV